MAMSKKNYVAFAKILKVYSNRAWNAGDTSGLNMVVALGREFADYFKSDNARFDRERFLKAAGLSD